MRESILGRTMPFNNFQSYCEAHLSNFSVIVPGQATHMGFTDTKCSHIMASSFISLLVVYCNLQKRAGATVVRTLWEYMGENFQDYS